MEMNARRRQVYTKLRQKNTQTGKQSEEIIALGDR
jgi:hypothetical protein